MSNLPPSCVARQSRSPPRVSCRTTRTTSARNGPAAGRNLDPETVWTCPSGRVDRDGNLCRLPRQGDWPRPVDAQLERTASCGRGDCWCENRGLPRADAQRCHHGGDDRQAHGHAGCGRHQGRSDATPARDPARDPVAQPGPGVRPGLLAGHRLAEAPEGRDREGHPLQLGHAPAAPLKMHERRLCRIAEVAPIDEVDESVAMASAAARQVDHSGFGPISSRMTGRYSSPIRC